MDVFEGAERLMGMSDRVWMRHANPLSAWTRLLSAPLFFLAIWSWTWIGWWALIPVAVMALWTWLNPRVFSPATNDDAWATKAVFGERIFLSRKVTPIPEGFQRAAYATTAISAVGAVPAIIGFVLADFWMALGGFTVAVLAKIWFIDRCVWLYERMKDATPEYRAWREGKLVSVEEA